MLGLFNNDVRYLIYREIHRDSVARLNAQYTSMFIWNENKDDVNGLTCVYGANGGYCCHFNYRYCAIINRTDIIYTQPIFQLDVENHTEKWVGSLPKRYYSDFNNIGGK